MADFGEAELNINVNLQGVREQLLKATDKLRLTIDEFKRVWLPIEEFIGSLTWEEVQEVFPDASLTDLWKLWEAAADKHQGREETEDGPA
jgi:hypothetical protein